MVTDNPVRSDRSATPTVLARSHCVSTGESAPSSKADRTHCPGLAGLTFAVLTLGSLAASAPAQAFNLGPAQDYNLFVLGNMQQHASDVEGRVAVGGNLTLTDFEIGLKAPTNSPVPNLVVGGSLDFTRGTIHGNAVYGQGQSLSLTNVTSLNAASSPVTQQDNSTFFSQAGQTLNAISNSLMGLQGSSVSAQYDGLTLKGADTKLNVFNLTNIDWSGIKYLNIDAPSTSQVLVNIAGKSVKWNNMGFGLNGVARKDVLYNLYEATNLEASGVGIEGSVLATKASFWGANGVYNGQGIFQDVRDQQQIGGLAIAPSAAQGISGATAFSQTSVQASSIQGNQFPNDPGDPTSVPTPSLLGGLVSLGLTVWRKRRQAAQAAA
jgi:choice-of-anchor A domain-containing protein